MKVTQAQLTASKKQADAIKNSDIAKQYDNAIDKAKEVKSLNSISNFCVCIATFRILTLFFFISKAI